MAFGLPYEVCIVGMAVVTCIYVVLGGYMATVLNDFIQGIIMLIGIVAVIVAVLAGQGGFSEAIISLSQIPAESSALESAFISMFGPDLFNLLGVIILTSLEHGAYLKSFRSSMPLSRDLQLNKVPSFLQFLLLSLLGEVISWEDLADCLEIKSPMLLMELLFTIR